MTANAVGSDRSRAFGETFGFTVLAATLYWLTWQEALHGTDWRWFVLWLDEPGVVHPQHPGYLVVADALRWLLSPLQTDAYGVLKVFSIAGGSIAVAGLHRTAHAISGDPWFVWCATFLAMISPALWHHATVVELHAPFIAVIAWASWMAVRWIKQGDVKLAVLTGVLTGLATLMHATGHMFTVVIAATIGWHCRTRGIRWLIGSSSAFAVTHGLVWGSLFLWIRVLGDLPRSVAGFSARPGDLAAPDNPLAYLLRWFQDMDLWAQFAPTVLNEWLQSFAPVSVVVLVALVVPRWRFIAVLFVAVLLLYLVATVGLVHAWTDERGAYLLPLLLPAIALTLNVVPRRIWSVLLVLGLVFGLTYRGEPGREPPDRSFGAAAAAMARVEPTVFFVADFPEMDGAFVVDPRLDLMLARKEHDELQAARASTGTFAPTPEQIAGWLTLLTVQAKDKQARLVITDRAVAWMSERVTAFDKGFTMFVDRIGAQRLLPETGIAGYIVR